MFLKGILVHAFNNEEIDYVKQACMVAERAKVFQFTQLV